jgi:hypothetical protein
MTVGFVSSFCVPWRFCFTKCKFCFVICVTDCESHLSYMCIVCMYNLLVLLLCRMEPVAWKLLRACILSKLTWQFWWQLCSAYVLFDCRMTHTAVGNAASVWMFNITEPVGSDCQRLFTVMSQYHIHCLIS